MTSIGLPLDETVTKKHFQKLEIYVYDWNTK
jgi:hypothetical protein